MDTVGYIYKTTNLINGKIYIGQHQNEYPDKDYFGSGKLLRRALKKYGKNNFILDILYWAKTIEELNAKEIKFIETYNSTNIKIGYNISNGGLAFTKGLKHSEECKRKIGMSLIGKHHSEETKIKMRLARNKIPEEVKNRARQSVIEYNKKRHISDETKEKWRLAAKGKKASNETKSKMSKIRKGRPTWNKGIPHTEETKHKMRQAHKTITEETRMKLRIAQKLRHIKHKKDTQDDLTLPLF